MQIPIIYYLIENFKKENFSNKEDKSALLSVSLVHIFLLYISTLISVYASVLAWETTKGSTFRRLNIATLANIFSIFYLIYFFVFRK